MLTLDRPVRFEDVDAAQIVFFANFFSYCHEAMEALFAELPGGYVDLITERHIGFPAVHVEADFKLPLRYGDVARVAVSIAAIGTTSCTFHYDISRAKDGAPVAIIAHVCVLSDLRTVTKIPIPDDVRAVLDKHRVV